jgi:glycerophosphoryl diester phosphodiesterase
MSWRPTRKLCDAVDRAAGGVFGAGPRPVLVGHRGLGSGTVAGHDANTLGSFLAAAEILPWVEVDVRRSADDVLFVQHDPAYPDGTFLADLSAAQVAARGTLPLADLLAALPPGIGVDLDLKTAMEDAARPRGATTAALLAPVAEAAAADRPVLVTSFDPSALLVLAELAPAVPRGLLTWLSFPAEHAVAAAAHLDVAVLAVHTGSLGWGPLGMPLASPQLRPLADVAEAVHRSGRELLAWCPTAAQARDLAAAGVDALCVNDAPAWAGGIPAAS